MADSPSPTPPDAAAPLAAPSPGPLHQWLRAEGFDPTQLEPDHLGVERIGVEPLALPPVAIALKAKGFDYLQVQGAYDEGPGKNLVSFYHLVKVASSDGRSTEEVRLEVSLARDGELTIPSLYPLYRGADWQERESFDMFGIHYSGHPHPKRLLMPEDWVGYPLRKDYVQPDFYELQDAH